MEKLFGCMGFPRGATHYSTDLLQHNGFDIRHERMGRDGICDWRLILFFDGRIDPYDKNLTFDSGAEDTEKNIINIWASHHLCGKVPYLSSDSDPTDEDCIEELKKINEIKFKHKIFFVRDPWSTISTLNHIYGYPYGAGALPCFVYFSKNELKFGQFDNSIHRTCLMYLEYAELMEKHCDVMISVKNIVDELNIYFEKVGLDKRIEKELTPPVGTFDEKIGHVDIEEMKKQISSELFEKINNFVDRLYSK